MFAKALCATLPLLAALPQANAWGALGHATVGYIAQNFVNSDTEAWAKAILKIPNDTYMASVASWADTYRYTKAGSFSEPFHFLDAEDSPPTSCNVSYSRDCGETGCIVAAVQNYTTRVQDTSLSAADRKIALEFLIHFFGDLTQPLHNENVARGGNEYDVTFQNETTNLHHIWDTNMLELLVGGYKLPDAERWAATLSDAINDGIYQNQTASWIAGLNLDDPLGSAIAMSADANMFVCSYVLAPGLDYIEGTDLSGEYYEGAIPIFTEQIAKGGYRLATWLNMIVNASSSDSQKKDFEGKEELRR